jgi:cell wall-associated NlpC family hydrolase
LARDWYAEKMGLNLGDYERRGEWWNKGLNTFVDNFMNEGFVAMEPEAEPQWGDALLMQLQSPVPSHVAVYVGNDLILHHLRDRLSSRDLLSGYYQKNTTHVLRHKSRL